MKLATLILMIGGMMAVLGGCMPAVGLFADTFIPEKTIKAEYTLKEDTLLIWVVLQVPEGENEALLRREMTEKLRDLLVIRKAAREVIKYEEVSRFRRQRTENAVMEAEVLGQELKANKVLYVVVQEFRLVPQADNGFYDVHVGGHCKLVEVASGKQLWPLGMPERTFVIGNDVTPGSGPTFMNRVIRQISHEFAQTVGPSFYDHKQGKI